MILITIFIAIFGPNICIGSITNESLNNQKELTILNIGNEINQLLSGVSSVCRESIVPGERECYMRYLDRYADLSRQVINEDISSEFDRKVCCSMWHWFDCTRSRIRDECTDADVDTFEQSLVDSYMHSSYCKGYEYGSYYCWPLPLWQYILFGSIAFAMLTLGTVAIVWYWRHGYFHSQRQRRRSRRRQ